MDWYNQDLDKARELLAEAGYPGGEGLSLSLFYSEGDDKIAQTLVIAGEELGIEIEAQVMNWGAMVDSMADQEVAPDIALGAWWPDYPDPDSFLGGITGYYLWSAESEEDYFYYNEDLHQLIQDAAFEQDIEQREDMYYRAQEIMVEDIAGIWVYDKDLFVAMDTDLMGFEYNPWYFNTPDFYHMYFQD